VKPPILFRFGLKTASTTLNIHPLLRSALASHQGQIKSSATTQGQKKAPQPLGKQAKTENSEAPVQKFAPPRKKAKNEEFRGTPIMFLYRPQGRKWYKRALLAHATSSGGLEAFPQKFFWSGFCRGKFFCTSLRNSGIQPGAILIPFFFQFLKLETCR
jgi:hypothetical protein